MGYGLGHSAAGSNPPAAGGRRRPGAGVFAESGDRLGWAEALAMAARPAVARRIEHCRPVPCEPEIGVVSPMARG